MTASKQRDFSLIANCLETFAETFLIGKATKPFDGGRVLKSFQKKRTLMLKL